MGTVFGIDELRLDNQEIAALKHSADQRRAYPKLLADSLRIDVLAFVTEHCAPGHHSQLRKLRKTVDYAFGDPVREVFSVGVSSLVDQWQDSQRIDRSARSTTARRLRFSSCRASCDGACVTVAPEVAQVGRYF